MKMAHQISARPYYSLALHTYSLFYQLWLTTDFRNAKEPSESPLCHLPKWHLNKIPTCITSLPCTGPSSSPHLCSSVCYTPGLSAVAEKLWPHQHQYPLGSHGLPNWTQCLRAAAGRESIPKSSKVNQKSKVMKHNKQPL